jgi:hypothetical membrane protein
MIVRFTLAFAILGIALVIFLTVIGGAVFPDYSHTSQFISELGAIGAPHSTLIRFGGFLPAGVFLCLFTVGAFKVVPRSRITTLGLIGIALFAVGYIAAAFFPCDPGCRPVNPSASQIAHNIFGLIGYLLAPLTLFLLGWKARHWPGGSHLTMLAFVASATSLIGLLTLDPASPYAGLAQRTIEASVLIWLVFFACYVNARRFHAS